MPIGRKFLSVSSLLVLVCLLFATSAVAQASSASGGITGQYKDKLVSLRNPVCGNPLRFDEQGKLMSPERPGNWETCQGLRIREVHVENGEVKIEAQRVRIFYDCATMQLREVAGAPPIADVSLELQLPPKYDDTTISRVMDKSFLRSDKSEGISTIGFAGGILKVGMGVTPPVAVYSPEPSYSEEALKAKYQGTVVLTIVVGADGAVKQAAVVRSLGMGLDENAIETVRTWRFNPATRCGKAVAVEVSVEIAFELGTKPEVQNKKS